MSSKRGTARLLTFGTTIVLAGQIVQLGCTSQLGDADHFGNADQLGDADPDQPGATGGGTSSLGSETGGQGSDGTVGPPPVDAPSPGFIRRMTHREYDNTIADLLHIDLELAPTFESDLTQEGFTNNAAAQNVSPTLAEQYVAGAEAVSEVATLNIDSLLSCDALEETACVQAFIDDFGARAWRRPLEEQEKTKAFELFAEMRAESDLDVSVRAVIEYFLIAPHFVYLIELIPADGETGAVHPLSSWELATRLSYFFLGSMPDPALFEAARAGELETAEGVATQARRLLTLPRARERIGLFYEEWLHLRHIDRLQRDPVMFPDFDLSTGPLMREQVKLFVQSIILDQDGSAIDLLTSSSSFLSPELAPLYGTAQAGPVGEFQPAELDPNQRAGLLTHTAVMASLGHYDQTNPVQRGKFVRTGLLCESIQPPPPDAVISIPEVEPGTSTRERFRIHLEDPTCRTCHLFMDPIGLGFEHYDALGQWREEETGLPIDASGEIVGTDVAGPFNGAIELAHQLAESDQTMECMTRTWLRFALGRSGTEADEGTIQAATQQWEDSGYVMKELLVALTRTNAFRQKRVLDPNTSSLNMEMP